jgi:hypothetical protein
LQLSAGANGSLPFRPIAAARLQVFDILVVKGRDANCPIATEKSLPLRTPGSVAIKAIRPPGRGGYNLLSRWRAVECSGAAKRAINVAAAEMGYVAGTTSDQ